jgi:hypothetical protein
MRVERRCELAPPGRRQEPLHLAVRRLMALAAFSLAMVATIVRAAGRPKNEEVRSTIFAIVTLRG